ARAPLHGRPRGRGGPSRLSPAPRRTARDFDIGSIRLNGAVPADATGPTTLASDDRGGASELTVKCDRAAVAATVRAGERVPMSVTGMLAGEPFAGADTVRVVGAGGRTPVSQEDESEGEPTRFALAVRAGT